MTATELDTVINVIPTLSAVQLRRLSATVQEALNAREAEAAIEARGGTERPPCPRCGTADVIRWGHETGLQRWRCKGCDKTFNKLTCTPLARARKRADFFAAARDMIGDAPRSCRKLGQALGINRMTAWKWRMRLLTTLDGYGKQGLAGLVEADETFFRESRKGSREWSNHAKGLGPLPPRLQWREYRRQKISLPRGLSKWQMPVLVLRDRHGSTLARRIPELRYKHFEAELDRALAPDAVLCTDSAGIYRRYSAQKGRKVEQVNIKRGIHVRDGVFHIQNANSFHGRLKSFMQPFRGPATKHLSLYVGWMALRDELRNDLLPGNPLVARLLA